MGEISFSVSILSSKQNNMHLYSSLNKILHISEITFQYKRVKNHINSIFTRTILKKVIRPNEVEQSK